MPDEEEPFIFGSGEVPEEIREVIERYLRHRMESGEDLPSSGMLSLDPDKMPPEVAAAFRLMILRRNMAEAASKDSIVDQIRPSDEQLHLNPGDRCCLAAGVEEVEAAGLTLLEVIDPREHADLFPDWEERMQLSEVVPAKYWTSEDFNEESLGWFPRIALILLPEAWMWDEYWQYMVEGTLPADPPEWMIQRIIDNVQGVSEANGGRVPFPMTCIQCGSTAVLFEASEVQTHKYFVGYPRDHQNDHVQYVTYAKHGHQGERTAVVACYSCGYRDNLFDRDTEITLNEKHDFEVS